MSKSGFLFSINMICKLIIAQIFQELSANLNFTVLWDNSTVSSRGQKRVFSFLADETCTSLYTFLHTNYNVEEGYFVCVKKLLSDKTRIVGVYCHYH